MLKGGLVLVVGLVPVVVVLVLVEGVDDDVDEDVDGVVEVDVVVVGEEAPEFAGAVGVGGTAPRVARMSLAMVERMLRARVASCKMMRPDWACCTCKLSTL